MRAVIRNIPSYEKMPFDKDGKHATGREVAECVYSTSGSGEWWLCWKAEYEGDSTCELPTTDILARAEELNRIIEGIDNEIRQAQRYGCSDLIPDNFGEEYFEEQDLILRVLYEYWADHVLMEHGIDAIPQDMEELFEFWRWEKEVHAEPFYDEEIPFN